MLLCFHHVGGSNATSGPNPDVMYALDDGLKKNSIELGHAEQAILGVQSEINQAEKKLLGRVFDVQSTRNFLARHAQLQTENAEMKVSMGQLNQHVEMLSDELEDAQRKYVAATYSQHKLESNLEERIAVADFTIEGLRKALENASKTEAEHSTLGKIRQQLDNETMEVRAAVAAAHDELEKAKNAVWKEENVKHPNLHQQLIAQHAYGVDCHAKVHELDEKLRSVLAAEPQEAAAAIAAAEHGESAAEAAEQRLKAENELLKQQLAHVQNDHTMLQQKDNTATQRINGLKAEIAADFASMTAQMGKFREHAATIQDALQENINARKKLEADLALAEEELEDLKAQGGAHGMNSLKAENARLEQILAQQRAEYEQSQTRETEALAVAQQKRASNAALKVSALTSKKQAEEAMQEGRKEVQEAAAESEKAQAGSDALEQKAEVAIATKCKPVWGGMDQAAGKKEAECKVFEEDLLSANAEIETLKVSLEAKGLKV